MGSPEKRRRFNGKGNAIGGFGTKGVTERIEFVNNRAGFGYETIGEHEAPSMESLLENGSSNR